MNALFSYQKSAALHQQALHIRACALAERMPPCMIDCHRPLADWLLMHFHDPVHVSLANGRLHLQPTPTLLCWAPGQHIRYGHPDQPWTHSWLHLAGAEADRLMRTAPVSPGQPLPAPWLVPTGEFFHALHAELTAPSHPDRRILRNLVEIWLIRLRRSADAPAPNIPPSLLAVKTRMESMPGRPCDISTMAREAGMSVTRFCEAFRTAFGTSAVRYQNECRIEQAKYRLRIRRERVGEVAAALGFGDAFTFSKAFKRFTGQSPRAYANAAERK